MIRKLVMGVVLSSLLSSVSTAAVVADPTAPATIAMENFRYTWRLRGGLAWIASVRFPTSGDGNLTTVYHRTASPTVDTELKITARDTEGFYVYQSQIDEKSIKTLMTYHGYSWGEKSRHERTFFDYVKRLARIRKETNDGGVEHRVKAIPPREMKDVLTGIYLLRQKAGTLREPLAAEIYSDGKLYPVMFRPEGTEVMIVNGQKVQTNRYRITAAPGAERKWPGGVRLWLTTDEKHVPVRIEINRSFATLRLDLTTL